MQSSAKGVGVVGPSARATKNRGWAVTFAGMGINLALGVLYSWSVVSKAIPAEWGWSEAGRSLPYSVACLVFSLVMVPAGRMQDGMGPRKVATIGGVLVGAGMILASLSTSLTAYVVGFGVLAGAGIGFGYAATTPAAVKWFPASRTGLVTGLVVGGFGLASVYMAPLANSLIGRFGVPSTMLVIGIGFVAVVAGLAQVLRTPPAGFRPPNPSSSAASARRNEDFTPGEVLRTGQFYLLWFMLACGAGAGLMIISKLVKLVEVQTGLALGFLLVAVLALGNGGGRILGGMLSDKVGRKPTMFACFVMQAVAILLLAQASAGQALGSVPAMVVLSMMIGANYGANLAVFPSLTKDFYGLKNFGANYGLVFTAWGLGGFTLSLLAGAAFDRTNSFVFAYYFSAALLAAAAIGVFFVHAPARPHEPRYPA
ncbi:MAG: OFA family MFS transporter [Vicinamibacterales bacterium]